MGTLARSVLVTGFPGRQPAVHLVRELALHGERPVCCVVTEGREERAREVIDELPGKARERVTLWTGDPRSIDLCNRIGLNYVSCSPFRVPIARLAAAHAALNRKATE